MAKAWLNRIGTAVPPHEIHQASVAFCRTLFPDERGRTLFERMVAHADIHNRFSIFAPHSAPQSGEFDREAFYRRDAFPSTATRMVRFENAARALAAEAVTAVDLGPERSRITHLIVASCTGFSAPGLDFQIMRDAGLPDTVERTIVGFMGCFAAVNALKLARHILRSEPHARVLVVNLELCSLHLQEQFSIQKLMSFLLFADGASAALVTSDPNGISLDGFGATVIPNSEDLITWHIRDTGFEMHLSGQVPGRIRRFLLESGKRLFAHTNPETLWAVHAGGRSILDAVQQGLALAPEALRHSRSVLREFGNMSSATLMFVLQRILRDQDGATGVAMAFGPGLTVESFAFSRA